MKNIFLINWWVDASNYIDFEDYVQNIDFDPYFEKSISWKHTLWDDLWDDYRVITIPMPSKDFAQYKYWKIMFEKVLPMIWDDDVLIWHSMWAIFLLKYFSENPIPKSIWQFHLVAPAMVDTPVEKLWSFLFNWELENFKHIQGKLYFYFSKDDDIVPFENYDLFKQTLPDAIYNIYYDYWHFVTNPKLNELIKTIKW